jgi:ribosomal-protein-alanine N-acetyltransferase
MSSDGPIPDLVLETPRLLIRPMRSCDRDEFVRVHTISEAYFAPWMPARDDGRTLPEFFDFLLERSAARAAAGTGVRLVGLLKDPGVSGEPSRLVANLNLNNIVRGVFQNTDAGWSVSVDAAGMGLGTEGVGGMLDLALSPPPGGLGLHRVQANVIPRNIASLRVAEKCGFRREGVGQRMVCIAGRWEDHVMFAKLADEHWGSRAP